MSKVSGGELDALFADLTGYLVNKGLIKKIPNAMLAREKKVMSLVARLYCGAPTPSTKRAILSTVVKNYEYVELRRIGFSCGQRQYRRAEKHAPGKWPEQHSRIRVGRKRLSKQVYAAISTFAYRYTKGSAHETVAVNRSAIMSFVHLRHRIHEPCMNAKRLAEQMQEESSLTAGSLSVEELQAKLEEAVRGDSFLMTRTIAEYTGSFRCCLNERCPLEAQLHAYDPTSDQPKHHLYDAYTRTRELAEQRTSKQLLTCSRRTLHQRYLDAGNPRVSLQTFINALPSDIGDARCRTGRYLHLLVSILHKHLLADLCEHCAKGEAAEQQLKLLRNQIHAYCQSCTKVQRHLPSEIDIKHVG